ncbi:MAG: hypothetical protein EXS34_02985 [Lacunisphaera sp.]|nr:hypothetical protein [Lacunisphaera sp.]
MKKSLLSLRTYSVGGSEGIAFEKEFAAFVGSAEAISVNSCSSGLELVAELAGLKPGVGLSYWPILLSPQPFHLLARGQR